MILGQVRPAVVIRLSPVCKFLFNWLGADRGRLTNDNGLFEFHDLEPEVAYRISVRREGFADWKSPVVTLVPNESRILTSIRLVVAPVRTTNRLLI
jgi:hypothetical protein